MAGTDIHAWPPWAAAALSMRTHNHVFGLLSFHHRTMSKKRELRESILLSPCLFLSSDHSVCMFLNE